MGPRGRGQSKNLSFLATWPFWIFVPFLSLSIPVSCSVEYFGPKISSTFDGMYESFGRNETLQHGFCFHQVGSTFDCSWGGCANTVGETAPLGNFGWLSGSPSEPVSISVTDRPPTRFKGYHGPALPLSFRWRKTTTLQCPAPDTHAHLLVGLIRTRHQCSLDSAPSPKAPAKPNPTRALKVRLDFFCLFDDPPQVGGCISKRQQKKDKKKKKVQARVKRQQDEKKKIALLYWLDAWRKWYQDKKNRACVNAWRKIEAAWYSKRRKEKEDRGKNSTVPETANPRYESPRAISLRIALAEWFIWCFVDDMLLADVLRFGVILSATTAPSVYDRVFTTAPSVYETGNPRYESRDILLRMALAECFFWFFVDSMLLADALRFGVILLLTTAPSVHDRDFRRVQRKLQREFQQQQKLAAAAFASAAAASAAPATTAAKVIFLNAVCDTVFTVHD